MKSLRITAVSLNTTPLDFEGNCRVICNVLEDPSTQESDVVLFPELSISGYGCEDAFFQQTNIIRSWNALLLLLPYSEYRTLVVGLPVFFSPFLYNCVAVLDNQKIKCLIPKINLANTGIHYEKRWFQPSDSLFQNQFLSPNEEWIPFGHYLLEKSGFFIGVEICEDSWSMNRPAYAYNQNGMDILLSPGASHFAIGKASKRESLFAESSRNQSNLQVFTNLVGNESGRVIYDGGAFIAHNGKILKRGANLSFEPYSTMFVDISLDELRSERSKEFRNTNPNTKEKVSILSLSPLLPLKSSKKETKPKALSEYDEFAKAVALGLFDYARKSNCKGFTVSLSGGADSSLCAVFIKLAWDLAEKERGLEYLKSLGWDRENFLVTFYQKTNQNSQATQDLAKSLAQELSAKHFEIDIQPHIDSAVSSIEQISGQKLDWKSHDLPLQNIQARMRSPLVWLLANLSQHLLVSTGNRSEASVGYTTMDGDASGSLCPIAGVSKEYLLRFIEFISQGKSEIIPPYQSFAHLASMPPTAELKPLSEGQTDEKDLMPYEILQKIEHYSVFLGYEKRLVLSKLLQDFPSADENTLLGFIDKFHSLFVKAQWKRERLAPSFHLDEYSLDPKSYYRFPILSKPTDII